MQTNSSAPQTFWGWEAQQAAQKPAKAEVPQTFWGREAQQAAQTADRFLPGVNFAAAQSNGVSHDGHGNFYRDGKRITLNEVDMWSRL